MPTIGPPLSFRESFLICLADSPASTSSPCDKFPAFTQAGRLPISTSICRLSCPEAVAPMPHGTYLTFTMAQERVPASPCINLACTLAFQGRRCAWLLIIGRHCNFKASHHQNHFVQTKWEVQHTEYCCSPKWSLFLVHLSILMVLTNTGCCWAYSLPG